ncbi:MAG TPA: Gldg family protein [Candidatus Paceibacterota bacterium]|nr:Gldg family protein [Candidatus Paceibacterota bacterium]
MRTFTAFNGSSVKRNQLGQSFLVIFLVAVICAGLGAGVVLYLKAKPKQAVRVSILSGGTLKTLQNLASPVEIRFYSLLDPKSVSDSVREFSDRVDQLLKAYEQEGAGKISVARHTSIEDANASTAAVADGIRPFNIDKGDTCFLGIAVVQDDRKESLPQLSPEWETALEADLTRAIARVSTKPASTAQAASAAQKIDPAVIQQVKRIVPDYQTMSLDEAKRILQEADLKEFKAAVDQIQAETRDAERRLGNQGDPQAIVKELQELHAAQTEKLKAIAARATAREEALTRLKQDETPVQK